MDEEGLKKTVNKKIFIGNQIDINADSFLPELDELRNAAESNESDKVLSLLENMVPTFNHLTN